jgi:Tfp pilus assembly protein PilV
MNIDKRRIVRRPAQRARGFSIIEALIAALVLSFGMMAIAGMQIGMSRNADVSKQRTEATRLAQQRMEQLRSWVGRNAPNMRYNLASLGVTGSTANAVLPVRDTVVGDNATFTRDWSVLGDSANLRQMVVTVTWRDRTEEEHTVTLNSVIATASQTDAGVIAASPVGGVGPSLTGRNQRDNRVPYDAVSIGTGRSTYRWPGTGQPWLVFDDTNANILYRCAAQPTSVTDLAASCLAIRGYVLAGYLSRADATWPTPVNLCGLTSAANVASVNCFVQDVILGTGFNLSVNGACPYVSLDSVSTGRQDEDLATLQSLQPFKCYAAFIEIDPAALSTTGWTGRMTFGPNAGAPAYLLNDSSVRICRFRPTDPADESTRLYSNIRQSLNNQTYLVQDGQECTSNSGPGNGNNNDTNLAPHQPFPTT